MRILLLKFILIFNIGILPLILSATTTYYSQGSLAPNLPSSWNSNPGGGGSTPGNFTAGDVFTIQNGHSMTTTASWSISGTGSKLIINNGGTLVATSAVTLAAATTFQIDDGGTYKHGNVSAYGSTIFQAGTKSFSSNSNVELNNSNSSGPSGITFGNLIVNFTTDPGGAVSCGGGLTTINGNFSIQSTMTREFRLGANSSITLNISGNLSISSGILNLSSGTGSNTININGDYNQTGGTFTQTGSNSSTINFNGSDSKFIQSGGTFTNTNMNFAINSTKKLTLNNDFPIATSRTLTVNGTLVTGTYLVSGPGSFILTTTTGFLSIGSVDGITSSGTTGNIQNSGTRTFNSANYIYNGSSAQVTGNGLPASIVSLTNSNSSGLTLTSALSISGSLTNSGTFDIAGLTLSAGSYINTGGIIKFSGASNGTAISTGTVEYYGATQTVKTGTYSTLTLSTNGTKGTDGALTVTTLNNTNPGTTLNMGTNTLAVTNVNNSGTIRTQSTSSTALSSGKTWGGEIQYDASTGGQTIAQGTYAILTLGNASGTQTASGSNSSFTATTLNNQNSGSTLNMVDNTLSATTVNNSGTIRTQSTSSSGLSSGLAWGGTITFDKSTGGQTIPNGTFNILNNSNTSGNNTASGAITATTFNNNNGATLDMVGYSLSGSITNNATAKIRFSGASNGLAISPGTIEYYGSTQSIATGTYATLNITATGTKTALGDITSTNLNNNSGAVLNMGIYNLTGIISNTGSTIQFSGAANGLAISTGTVVYNGGAQTIASGTYSTLSITTSGNKTAAGDITTTNINNNAGAVLIMDVYTLSGTISNTSSTIQFAGTSNGRAAASGTIEYNGTIDQTITVGTYNNLTTSGSNIKSLGGSGTIINGILSIGSGTILSNVSTYDLTINNNWVNNGDFIPNSGTVYFGGTTTISGSAENSFYDIYNGGTLTAPNANMNISHTWINDGTFNHNNGTISFIGASSISGGGTHSFKNINISGSLTGPTGNMNVAGDWTNTGTYSPNGGTVTLNSNSSPVQTLTGTTNFHNLTINNSSGLGILLTSSNTSVSGTLTLTNGVINTTDAYDFVVSNSVASSISGGSSTSYINGNLRRSVASGSNAYTYPIGTSVYTPVTITFSSSSGNGTLTGTSVDGDSPNIGSSNINPDESVNRYWHFTNSGLSGLSYGATFTWVSGDRDGGFDYTAAKCGKYDGSWTYPSTSGQGTTVATISGATSFSDFEFGNFNPLPVELSSFEAVKASKKVNLTWQTQSERNNAKFVVERSKDAVDYKILTEIIGAGNSSTVNNYAYTDAFPLAGNNYYRLKQVDYDGKYTYSAIRVVNFDEDATFNLFPTLVKDNLTIKTRSIAETETIIQIISLTNGVLVQQSSLLTGEFTKDMDISHLAAGSYIARLVNGQTVKSQKFMKQ